MEGSYAGKRKRRAFHYEYSTTLQNAYTKHCNRIKICFFQKKIFGLFQYAHSLAGLAGLLYFYLGYHHWWCTCALLERYLRVLMSVCFTSSTEHHNNLILIHVTSIPSRKGLFGAGVVLILRSLLSV